MTWFKVDDSFYDHPKSFDAPDCAVALWVRAGTWSARNLTEGFVPSAMLARLCGDPATAARELVRRGLWERTRRGYQFHDWTEYQPTRAKVEEERKKNAERQKLWRETHKSNGHRNGVTNGATNGAPDPTRPLPSTKEGRGRRSPASQRAAPPDNHAPRCPNHPTELATNCRSCAADAKGTA